ncbi:hypothetical protein [Clostridium sp. Marseille-P2415]|uniref:hypothetical protein n=1 Tax=Clostridium sp. Marseille-P2415 TaxID=1805471 RepID=UPI00098849A8|nr:hypothetical protein [Clostridium sp. Marseille-P2415]
MKKSNLITGIMFALVGTVLLLIALLTYSKLDGLLFGFAGAGIGPGIVMICKYFYWSTPKNKERYQERITDEKIEQHDELKVKLRDKSGRYSYVLGLIAISISMVVFSIMGALEITINSRMIILYLGGYLVFQIVAGIAIFNHLLKKY